MYGYDGHSTFVGHALIEMLKGSLAVWVREQTGCGIEIALWAVERVFDEHKYEEPSARSFATMFYESRQLVLERPAIEQSRHGSRVDDD